MADRRGGRLKAVFFDVGGTLLGADPSVGHAYASVLSGFGRRLDPAAVDRAFEEAWSGAMSRVPAGPAAPESAFWRDLLDGMMAALGAPGLSDAEFEAIYDHFRKGSSYRLFPEAAAVIEELHRREYVLGVISNWDGRLPRVLSDLGLARYFAVTVVSALEGHAKPARVVFERALARAGVGPSEALHVGDARIDDYEGARAAGLHALLLDRRRRTSEADVIHDLEGVLRRVDSMEAS